MQPCFKVLLHLCLIDLFNPVVTIQWPSPHQIIQDQESRMLFSYQQCWDTSYVWTTCIYASLYMQYIDDVVGSDGCWATCILMTWVVV